MTTESQHPISVRLSEVIERPDYIVSNLARHSQVIISNPPGYNDVELARYADRIHYLARRGDQPVRISKLGRGAILVRRRDDK